MEKKFTRYELPPADEEISAHDRIVDLTHALRAEGFKSHIGGLYEELRVYKKWNETLARVPEHKSYIDVYGSNPQLEDFLAAYTGKE